MAYSSRAPEHSFLDVSNPSPDGLRMNRSATTAEILRLRAFPLFIFIFIAIGLTAAQEGSKSKEARAANVQQELVRIETGFFEAWRINDQAYLRENMAENGIFWGEDGTLSRDQQLTAMQASAKNCTAQGFGLSDFGALPLASGAYLLIYKAQQYGTCNGEKLPLHVNGSSIYIFKAGKWQAIYRAQVPAKQW
jgi:hypothetical protein